MFTSIIARQFTQGWPTELCLFSMLNLKGSLFHLLSTLCCSAHYSGALCVVCIAIIHAAHLEKKSESQLSACLRRVTQRRVDESEQQLL